MRRYETIAIIDPDISEDDRTSLLTRIKEIIPQQEGVVIEEDLWGARKLAYPIKKKPRGYYARYDYCGMGNAVEELERFFRIDDRVLKYLTVLLNPEANVEKILAEIAEAKAATTGTTETVKAVAAEAPAAAADSKPAVEPESKPVQTQSTEAEAPKATGGEPETPAPADEAATETSEKE